MINWVYLYPKHIIPLAILFYRFDFECYVFHYMEMQLLLYSKYARALPRVTLYINKQKYY
jgi:hypothetical protein